MSKNRKSTATVSTLSSGGYLIWDDQPKQIIGKIITLIEALGLQHKQEESIKSFINRFIWEEFSKDHGAIHLSNEIHSELRHRAKELQEQIYSDSSTKD